MDNLNIYYNRLCELKKQGLTEEFIELESEKNKLVSKLKRGFVNADFVKLFENELNSLDGILLSIESYEKP